MKELFVSGLAFLQKPAHNAEHTYLDADHCGPQQLLNERAGGANAFGATTLFKQDTLSVRCSYEMAHEGH
jgi:hypothetical protein